MGEKGLMEKKLEWQRKLEEEDNIFVEWAQEDVETLCELILVINQLKTQNLVL